MNVKVLENVDVTYLDELLLDSAGLLVLFLMMISKMYLIIIFPFGASKMQRINFLSSN